MRETPILLPARAETEVISGRWAPVEMAQPGWVGQLSLMWMGRDPGMVLTERCFHVGAHETVAAVALDVFLAQTGDPALGQADADINLAGADGRDHMAGARGERDQGGVEAIVLLGKVEGGREMLGYEADA